MAKHERRRLHAAAAEGRWTETSAGAPLGDAKAKLMILDEMQHGDSARIWESRNYADIFYFLITLNLISTPAAHFSIRAGGDDVSEPNLTEVVLWRRAMCAKFMTAFI